MSFQKISRRSLLAGAAYGALGCATRQSPRLSRTISRQADTFYVPENPKYTVVDSALDSVRFTVDKTLTQTPEGRIASRSNFVDSNGNIMEWHEFGTLEGPGWAANAVGGAYEIYRLGAFLGRENWRATALGILDHVLEDGFIDEDSGFIRGYRHIPTNTFCLNYTHSSEWFCPGSMAKIAFQLLQFADVLDDDKRAPRMRNIARQTATWIDEHVEAVPNGWFPRRCAPDGTIYTMKPGKGNKEDPFWQTSADGLFIVQLQTALTQRGLGVYGDALANKVRAFTQAGGFFASINHDTYDPQENVAYSVAFRTLLPASTLLKDDTIRHFAYERCLAGLERFKMCDDRNGVATTGLLYMEDSWDTAYLWENAEAALAYFEASVDTRNDNPEAGRAYELDGLTILRATAKHHYGPHGFLTEGVDWNNHVGREHHIGQAEFGAIQYTEPFLNNQHIVEPTHYYLENLARHIPQRTEDCLLDCEGNVLIAKALATKEPGPDPRGNEAWNRASQERIARR